MEVPGFSSHKVGNSPFETDVNIAETRGCINGVFSPWLMTGDAENLLKTSIKLHRNPERFL
jgi:hypothetical protein